MTSVNEALLPIFIEETEASLRALEAWFSATEPPGDSVWQDVQALLLNLKGGSSMAGLPEITRLSDLFLSLLEQRPADPDLAWRELTLSSKPLRSGLSAMIQAAGRRDFGELTAILESLTHQVSLPKPPNKIESDFMADLKGSVLREAREELEIITRSVNLIRNRPHQGAERHHLFLHLMTLRQLAGTIEAPGVVRLVSLWLSLLDAVEMRQIPVEDPLFRAFEACLGILQEAVGRLREGRDFGIDEAERFREEIQGLLPTVQSLPGEEEEEADWPAPAEGLIDEAWIRKELQRTFLTEADEHFEEISNLLLQKEAEIRDSREWINQLFRRLHTLKGSSATVGFHALSGAAHALEDLLESGRTNPDWKPEPAFRNRLAQAVGTLRRLLELSSQGEEAAARKAAETFIGELQGEIRAAKPSGSRSRRTDRREPLPDEESVQEDPGHRLIRVPMDRLDHLMGLVSELGAYRMRIDHHSTLFFGLTRRLRHERKKLNKILHEFARRHQWELDGAGGASRPGSDFSDSEMDRYSELAIFTRNLEDTEFKLASVVKQIENLISRSSEDGASLAGLIGNIQQTMIKVRLQPVEHLFRRLEYQVWSLSRALGKSVRVEISGPNTELDKGVADTLADILVHLLRNSLDHGIEPPDRRKALKKPETGLIRLSASSGDRKVTLVVEDDGAGIDLDAVRRAALRSRVVTATELAAMNEEETALLIFHPQVSTRTKAGEVSGRGIGMNIVRHAVTQLTGSIRVETEPGRGTRFILTLPLTLALQPVLKIDTPPFALALPMTFVETIHPTPESDQPGRMLYDGEWIPVRHLTSLLGLEPPPDSSNRSLVILGRGDRRMGLSVDALKGREEVIVRPLPELLSPLSLFSGSTLTASGDLRLILNVPTIFEIGQKSAPSQRHALEQADRLRVLVTDDSLSVRQTIKMLLEKHGIKANTAKDGLVAWQKIHGIRPHALLVDLEMPGLNGFELIERLRQSPDFAHLPLIVLTSRGGEKHRLRAIKLGADAFLTKPVLERRLLAALKEVLPRPLKDLLQKGDPTVN